MFHISGLSFEVHTGHRSWEIVSEVRTTPHRTAGSKMLPSHKPHTLKFAGQFSTVEGRTVAELLVGTPRRDAEARAAKVTATFQSQGGPTRGCPARSRHAVKTLTRRKCL